MINKIFPMMRMILDTADGRCEFEQEAAGTFCLRFQQTTEGGKDVEQVETSHDKKELDPGF